MHWFELWVPVYFILGLNNEILLHVNKKIKVIVYMYTVCGRNKPIHPVSGIFPPLVLKTRITVEVAQQLFST